MYIVVQCSARLAILLLYQRVFDTGSTVWFSMLIKICFVLQVVGETIWLFVIIFECRPISSVWDKSITNPQCLNLAAIYLAGAITSIVTDVILMILPMPMLWKLQMSRPKKLGIAMVFVVASL